MLLQKPFGEWMLDHAPLQSLYVASSGSDSSFPPVAGIISVVLTCVIIVLLWKARSVLLRRWRRGADRRPGAGWVRGTATVAGIHVLVGGKNGAPGRYRLDVVLSAPGMLPTAVRTTRWIKKPIWRMSRLVVPVLIDPVNPNEFAFLWDELPDTSDDGERRAHELERRMRAAAQTDEPTAKSPG